MCVALKYLGIEILLKLRPYMLTPGIVKNGISRERTDLKAFSLCIILHSGITGMYLGQYSSILIDFAQCNTKCLWGAVSSNICCWYCWSRRWHISTRFTTNCFTFCTHMTSAVHKPIDRVGVSCGNGWMVKTREHERRLASTQSCFTVLWTYPLRWGVSRILPRPS